MNLIVMVGVSGSGKSTHARENYPDHELISLDDIQNKDRTLWLNMIEQKLKESKSVVADDENATKTKRKQLIDLGREYGANITAVYLNMPLEKILERNKKRNSSTRISNEHIIRLYRAMKPRLEKEGFDDITEVNE